jgi:hypothetical protein
MSSRTLAIAVGLTLALAGSGRAMAQSGVEIESTAPAPPPKFEIIRPEQPGSEPTRTLDNDFPAVFGDPTVRYDPAFIAPFTKETSTGRMGLAGWTSPVGVVGADGPMNTRQPGWLSFGFAITWGGPPNKAVTPASAPR